VNIFKKNEIAEDLQYEIDAVFHEMRCEGVTSDKYLVLVAKLEKLMKLKGERTRSRISSDTLAMIIGNMLIAGLVIGFEQKHVINTKVFSFTQKLK